MSHSQELSAVGRVLMLGFGTTGRAVCEFAIRHSFSIHVSERERLSEEQLAWLENHNIPFEHSGHTARFLSEVDIVVLSPGIPLRLPILTTVREKGLPIVSETDFSVRLLESCTVVAVTGTNGKSSTVEVIARILQSLGRRAWVTGNIGIPLISIVDDVLESDIVVLEISSYQLEQSRRFRPQIGVLLNLTPDHIHRHGTMQAYANAKGRLFVNQESNDVAILPSTLASQFEQGCGRRVYYDETYERLPDSMDRLLPHERSNLRAALAACDALVPDFDVSDVSSEAVLAAFRLPHRMETLGCVRGVRVVNDSKSTNAGSAIAALRSIDSPVVLLLGGRSKGAGYESLIDEVAAFDSLREVVLFGEAAAMLRSLFARVPGVVLAPPSIRTMQDAVARGILAAQHGDVLLFSPACSSFDAFADFAERGEAFAGVIRSLPGFESGPART
ncbi:UDP-N-acetylmuramoyl-L-alanine--D-glutamate ligase [Candidatus Bipolaricaulota bacterium]